MRLQAQGRGKEVSRHGPRLQSKDMLSHFRGSPVTKPVVLETSGSRHGMRLLVEDCASPGMLDWGTLTTPLFFFFSSPPTIVL